jgi:hypothetical protein
VGHLTELFFADRAGWFGVPALVGTAFVVIRLLFILAGVDHGLADASHAGHFDIGHSADAGHDTVHAFQWLSVQGLVAFAAGFGWGGLGALKGSGMGLLAAVFVGICAGAGVMWLYAQLFHQFRQLEVSGNIAIDDTVGTSGNVYLTVPPVGAGSGQVTLTVSGRRRIYAAVSRSGEIPTGGRVRVVGVADPQTVAVMPD